MTSLASFRRFVEASTRVMRGHSADVEGAARELIRSHPRGKAALEGTLAWAEQQADPRYELVVSACRRALGAEED